MFRVCPRDKVELKPSKFASQVMDACPQCDGVWLDRGELEKILGLTDTPQRGGSQEDPQGAAECPDCHISMQAYHYSKELQVVIDECPKCQGIWLDAEEMRSLMKAVHQQRS